MSENKPFKFDIADGSLKIQVDSNKDGEPVLEFKISLSEILDEIKDKFFSKEEE